MANGDMCRVCLAGDGSEIKLIGVNNHLVDVYEKLTNTKMSEGEARLCYICLSQLQRCHRFTKMAQRSEKYMKTVLESEKQVKANTVSNMLNLVKLQTLSVKKLKQLYLDGSNETSQLKIQSNREESEMGYFVDDNNTDELKTKSNEITQVKKDVDKGEFTEINEEELEPGFEEDLSEVKDCIIITKMYYECGDCSMILETQEELTKHQNSHKESCEEVPPVTTKQADKVITKMYYECGGCSKILQSQEDLAVHQNSHSDPNSFHHHLLSKSDITENFKETSSNKLKAVNCSICKKYFNDTAQLYTHFKMHTGQRPFICDTCGKTFRTRCHLKAHFSIHTMEKVYCKICNKGFSQSSSLGRHMLLHTGEKPFFCHICGRRCKQSGQLRMHIRTVHEGIKLHECEVCNKRFSVNSELQRHMACHSGLKPFECEDCGIKVTTKTVLRRHKRSYCKKSC